MNCVTPLEKWNHKHREAQQPGNVAQVLLRNRHLLPVSGKALDLACGRGANALMLAKAGLETHAWDFSDVAVELLDGKAAEQDLRIETEVRDVLEHPPEPACFDVILVSFFLERRLIPALIQALRPGGKIFYQTFVRAVYLDRGPATASWRLGCNELLQLFAGLQVHYYREDGYPVVPMTEVSDLAMLVASKGS